MLFSRAPPSTFPFPGTIAHAGVFEIAVGARVPKSRTHAYAQTVRHESQMNETAEGCVPRWSRVFSRHHCSSLENPSPRPFFPSFPRSSFLPFLLRSSVPSFPPSWHSHTRFTRRLGGLFLRIAASLVIDGSRLVVGGGIFDNCITVT